MMSLLLATFAGLLAPVQFAAVDPEISIIQRTDGTTVYGYVKSDKDGRLEVVSDSASDQGETLYIPVARVVSREIEPKSRRNARLQEQSEQEKKRLKDLGLSTVAGRNIPTEELQYAERAKAMALELETVRRPSSRPALPQAGGDAAATVETPAVEAPGFLRLWGRHLLVGIAGLALGAIVIKTLLL